MRFVQFVFALSFLSLIACNTNEPGGYIIDFDSAEPVYENEVSLVDTLLNYNRGNSPWNPPQKEIISHSDSFLVIPTLNGKFFCVSLPQLSFVSSGQYDATMLQSPLHLTHIHKQKVYFIHSDSGFYHIKGYSLINGDLIDDISLKVSNNGSPQALHCRDQYLYGIEHFVFNSNDELKTNFQVKRIDLTNFEETSLYESFPLVKYSNTAQYALASDETELYFHYLTFGSAEDARSNVDIYRFSSGVLLPYYSTPYDISQKPKVYIAGQYESILYAAGNKLLWYDKVDNKITRLQNPNQIIDSYVQAGDYIIEHNGNKNFWRIDPKSGKIKSMVRANTPVFHKSKKLFSDFNFKGQPGISSYCVYDEYSSQALSCYNNQDPQLWHHFLHQESNSLISIGFTTIYRFNWPF